MLIPGVPWQFGALLPAQGGTARVVLQRPGAHQAGRAGVQGAQEW